MFLHLIEEPDTLRQCVKARFKSKGSERWRENPAFVYNKHQRFALEPSCSTRTLVFLSFCLSCARDIYFWKIPWLLKFEEQTVWRDAAARNYIFYTSGFILWKRMPITSVGFKNVTVGWNKHDVKRLLFLFFGKAATFLRNGFKCQSSTTIKKTGGGGKKP